MKEFYSKLLIFILPLIVIGVVLEIAMRNIPNDYQIKADYLSENASEVECLILGSSHTFYGLDPNMLPGSFNAAYLSQSLDYDFKILKHYEDDYEQLKTVVLPISYLSLFEQIKYIPQSWRTYNYNLYYDLPGNWSVSEWSELLGKDLLENAKLLFKYYIRSQDRCRGDSLGFGKNDGTPEDLVSTGLSSAKHHYRTLAIPHNFEVWEENNVILEEFVQWTDVHQVDLVLLTTPCYESYVESVNQNQRDLFIARAQEVADNHSHVRYLNFFDSPLFSEQHFRDATHLNTKGATLLTELLRDALVDSTRASERRVIRQ